MFGLFKKKEPIVKLIVGLGNPGEKYAKNRHNIGFWVVDAVAERFGASSRTKKFNGLFATCDIDGEKVGLLWPQTYMNESGRSVQAAAAYYKIKPTDIFVVHDELDIATGAVKIKQGGGDAGHNGLKSITKALGKDYWRVRVGIDHPGDKNKVSSYVLNDFPKAEQPMMEELAAQLAQVISLIIQGEAKEALEKI